jgi:sarcosine oxidase
MINKNQFDVIVLGVGSLGSAACYHLAKRGVRVLGIDQFDVPHENGSHGGQSRIIRKAYFEHPDYVPLLQKAYALWHELEEETGEQVYFPTGLLYMGQSHDALISGVRKSSDLYQVEINDHGERHHDAFRLPNGHVTLFEPDAGFLKPEKSIRLHLQQSLHHGAVVKTRQPVISWKEKANGVEVVTASETYNADTLIICAGAWSSKVMPLFAEELVVSRQVLAWVMPKHPEKFMLGNFPCWTLADEGHDSIFYGFPILPEEGGDGPVGMKLAHHAQGRPVDPDRSDEPPSKEDEQAIVTFLNRFIPDGYDHTISMKTCRYTNSKDENFIIDRLPEHEHIFVATGCSGHAFKFSSAIGSIMADLSMYGKTDLPIGFLNAARLYKT